MPRALFKLFLLLTLSGCTHHIPDECRTGTDLYLAAFERELATEGIKSRRNGKGQVCYKSDRWLEADRAAARTEQYYRGAADLISNKAHEARVRNWLKSERRLFYESTTDSGKLFIVVYSGSKEEFEDTQFSLRCLAYQGACP